MRMSPLMHVVFVFTSVSLFSSHYLPPTTSHPNAGPMTSATRNSYTFGQSYLGYRGLYGGRTGSYLSSYQQRQQQRDSLVSSEDRVGSAEVGRIQDRLSFSGTTTTTTSSATTPSPTYVTAATTVTTSTSTTSSVFRRCVILIPAVTTTPCFTT